MFRPMIVAALVMGVAACASEPPRRELRHHGGPPSAEARHSLFLSPAGEPFRGGDGLAAWFAGADADHDGTLTRSEFAADAERFFHKLDTNNDGVVDGFEIGAYEQTVAPEITALAGERLSGGQAGAQAGAQSGEGQRRGGGMGGGRRGGMGHGGMGRRSGGGTPGDTQRGAGRDGAARYSLINEPEPLAGADENLDSRVTLEEWRHATTRRFAVLDRAGSGRLSLDQLRGERPKT